MIENLKNMIKKLAKDIEESLEKKVNADYYEKDKNKFGEKISHLITLTLFSRLNKKPPTSID